MKWAYDLCGAEPIIMDLPAYDSSTIKNGAMVMLSAAAFSAGGGAGRAVINAYNTTVASAHALNAIGISVDDTKTTSSSPSIATAVNTTAAISWIKTIVNPFAVYRAAYGTAEQIAITSCASTHLVAVAGIATATAEGYAIYFSNSAGPNFGHVSLCVISAAGDTFDLDAALTNTATTADKVMFITPQFTNGMPLTPDSTGVGIISAGTSCANAVLHTKVVDTWIDADRGFQRFNYSYTPPTAGNTSMSSVLAKAGVHSSQILGDGFKKGTNKPAKWYNDIVLKHHPFAAEK